MSCFTLSQIIATLAYSDQFSQPLCAQKIYSRLIAQDCLVGQKIVPTTSKTQDKYPLVEFLPALNYLVDQQVLLKGQRIDLEPSYVLNLPSRFDFFAFIKKRKNQSEQIIAKAQPLLKFVKNLGWVRAVGATGSVAMNNAKASDDLDLIILTQPQRLWLTRLVVLLWALVKKQKDWLCFNVWLATNELAVPPRKRSLYTAYEAVQVRWLYDRQNYQERFAQANHWVKNFLPQVEFGSAETKKQSLSGKVEVDFPGFLNWAMQINSHLLNLLNLVSFGVQAGYLHFKQKIPWTNLQLNKAYLHDQTGGERWLTRWKKTCALVKMEAEEISSKD